MPVYEHPWFVRFLHWTNAVAVTVMVLSGLQHVLRVRNWRC